MATHHELSAEHLSLVNTRDYGAARTEVTLQTVINNIGSAKRGIFLHQDDAGGDWFMNSPIVVPSTITMIIPPGVTVGGAANLTLNGPLIAYRRDWYVGSGTLLVAPLELDMSGLRVQSLEYGNEARHTRSASVILNAIAGSAPLVATGVVPQGARLDSVIKTILTGFTGITGMDVGDTCDGSSVPVQDRWGTNLSVAFGTQSDGRNFPTSFSPITRSGPANLLITPRGGNFTSTGSVRLDFTYTTYGIGSGAGGISPYRILKGFVSNILNVPTAYANETTMISVPLTVTAGDALIVNAQASLAISPVGATIIVRDNNAVNGPIFVQTHVGPPTFEFPMFLLEHVFAPVTGARTIFLNVKSDNNSAQTCTGSILSIQQYVLI